MHPTGLQDWQIRKNLQDLFGRLPLSILFHRGVYLAGGASHCTHWSKTHRLLRVVQAPLSSYWTPPVEAGKLYM
jgi:hypothetical protein